MPDKPHRKPLSQTEFEEIGGQVVAETVRDQMHRSVVSLRNRLAKAEAASAKSAATEREAMADYLGLSRGRRPSDD